jgi:prevent-host-death family protein
MTEVTLAEAQAKLPELVAAAARGEEVVITQPNQPAIKLVPLPTTTKPRPQFGSGKGLILYMAPDFDAPLDDFKEYMP